MPYLDGRGFSLISSFGKPTEGNFDVKNGLTSQWRQVLPFPRDRLRFGLTHSDTIVSQVREKTTQGFGIKMNNAIRNSDYVPSHNGITSFGTSSPSGPQFPNNGSQFHTQSPQIQNRRGSLWIQQKNDNKV